MKQGGGKGRAQELLRHISQENGERVERNSTFLTTSSRADLMSERFALFTFTVGWGSEVREEDEGTGERVAPLGTPFRGAIRYNCPRSGRA